MASTAETYRYAVKENLERAQELFGAEQYFLAHYLAGLAVECHLRAYLRRKTSEFDSRHDLRDLATESGYYQIVPAVQVSGFSAKFSLLNLRRSRVQQKGSASGRQALEECEPHRTQSRA